MHPVVKYIMQKSHRNVWLTGSCSITSDEWWERDRGEGVSLDDEAEGTAGDVLVSPLDHQCVVSAVFYDVRHVVLVATFVLDHDFFTGVSRTHDAYKEHVVT